MSTKRKKPSPTVVENRKSAPTKRARRSTAEIRKEILKAARELFTLHGYAGTSTKAIAERAKVQEPLLFRNFGNKANLFEESIFGSLDEYIHNYWETFVEKSLSQKTIADETDEYVRTVYSILMDNRDLVVTMCAANQELKGEPIPKPLENLFDVLEKVAAMKYKDRNWAGIDVKYAVRFTFALILSVVTFHDWIVPDGRNGRDAPKLEEELVKYIVNGVGHRLRNDYRTPDKNTGKSATAKT